MLGTFRLVLALAVALTHAGVSYAGLDLGVIAVVCFYLLSGYVMTGLIRTHYPGSGQAWRFYLDRVLRLWPHYLVVAGITLAWFWTSGINTYFLSRQPTLMDAFNNLVIVPHNYYMFNDASRFALVPVSWSLGAEIQFYFIAPLVVLTRLRHLVLSGSAAVFVLACFGVLQTEWYGYRLAAGVMFMFMIGSLLYDAHWSRDRPMQRRGWILLAWLAAVLVTAFVAQAGALLRPFNRETLIGLIGGISLLYVLGRLPRQRWDDRLGDLAYGVFLNHLTVQLFLFTQVQVTRVTIVLYLALSLLAASALFYSVERPIVKLRYSLRKGAAPATGTASAGR